MRGHHGLTVHPSLALGACPPHLHSRAFARALTHTGRPHGQEREAKSSSAGSNVREYNIVRRGDDLSSHPR